MVSFGRCVSQKPAYYVFYYVLVLKASQLKNNDVDDSRATQLIHHQCDPLFNAEKERCVGEKDSVAAVGFWISRL